jgi:hypothetical protein
MAAQTTLVNALDNELAELRKDVSVKGSEEISLCEDHAFFCITQPCLFFPSCQQAGLRQVMKVLQQSVEEHSISVKAQFMETSDLANSLSRSQANKKESDKVLELGFGTHPHVLKILL